MNYYNEHDPKAAAWLRVLIEENQIAKGEVDERDIQDVRAGELVGYRQCHFFAGIGGWSYALRLAGVSDDYPVWTGSCPCQPFSCAGRGLSTADERHLWPDFRNLIAECRPSIVFGEQVASPDGLEWLAGVSADLEMAGYAVGSSDLCAAGVKAPHPRQRLYWVADTNERPNIESVSQLNKPSRADGIQKDSARLAHSIGIGRAARSPSKSRQESGITFIEHASVPCGMVQPDRTGRDTREQTAAPARHRSSAVTASGVGVALGDTNRERLQRQRKSKKLDGSQERKIEERYRPEAGFWGDFEILNFTDGKSRRVEAGTFPLAHGIPNRVGLLRGYGNAIVPQVAAEFIRATDLVNLIPQP